MKIWLINHYAVPVKYYPLARQAYFAKYLMKMGHEVTIFAASTVHNSDINLITGPEKYREDYDNGIHYVYVKCRGYKGNGFSRIMNMFEFARKFPGICEKFEKPDAIVATSVPPMCCAQGIKLAKKYGCVAIGEVADMWPEAIVSNGFAKAYNPAILYLRKVEKWMYKNSDAMEFLLEGAYDYIKEQGWEKEIPKSKIKYINNGIDLAAFDYNAEHYIIDDADLNDSELYKIVYTGSIRRGNDLGTLVDVAKLIEDPKVKFLVWGAGDQLDELTARVKNEGITNIVFKGVVDKKYVPYITSHSDLNVVHFKMSDDLKYGPAFNKLFEYLAAGKPIFSTLQTPYSIIVPHECGFDTEGFSPEEIADGIMKMVNMPKDKQIQMGINARETAKEFDFENLTKKLVKIIEECNKKVV